VASPQLSNYQNFLTELMVGQQIVFGFEHPLLSELTGLQRDGADSQYVFTRDPNQQRFTAAMDVGKDVFHGKQLTVPLQLNDISSQAIAEKATFPVVAAFDTSQAIYNLVSRVTALSVTKELEDDAKDGSTAAMEAVAAYTQSAYRAHARLDNDFLHGSAVGTTATNGLYFNVASAAGSPGLTIPVTGANMDQLTPGRIVTILTRSTGANPGNGLRRKILSTVRTVGAETITVDTNAYASDGSSGNVTFSANEGVYVDTAVVGSATPAPFGLGSVCATSGTVGGINKASVAQWQGINQSGASAPLSDDLIDNIIYLLRGNGVGAPDFAIAHPLTVDPYKASKISLVRVDMQTVTLKSGFQGIVYQGADREFPILKDLAGPRKTCRFVYKQSLRLYGRSSGPVFIDDDGSRFRFFTRTTEKEADLYDRWQLVARDCGKNAELNTLSE
jgi:hypothetical protein